MKRNAPCFIMVLTLVSTLHAPRCPAQIQPAAIQDFQPPQLLTPENGSTIKGAPEFFWTSAVLPKGFRGSYKLKVVPVSPGQSSGEALAVNQPIHQATMRRTGEAYPADGPALKNGQTYAWCVQIMDANGNPVGENQGMSEVFVFTFGGAEALPAAQGLTVTTQPLVMTGLRVGSLTVDTQPLIMTGMRVQSITVNTQPLVMTGIRPESITLTTQPLVMTGIRVGSITINTDALKMTGMRNEQTKPPDGSDINPIQPTVPKEPKKKLDLPFKKSEPIEGGNPPVEQPEGANERIRGVGQALDGKTNVPNPPGETPALEPVQQAVPAGGTEPVDKTVSTPLKQKFDGLQDANAKQGIEPPVGTDASGTPPAGTGTPASGQKLKEIQENLKGNTPAGQKPADHKTGTDAGQK